MRAYEFLKKETINGVDIILLQKKNDNKIFASINSHDDVGIISIDTTRRITIRNPEFSDVTKSNKYKVITKILHARLEYTMECLHICINNDIYTSIPRGLIFTYHGVDNRFIHKISLIGETVACDINQILLILDPTDKNSNGELSITPVIISNSEGSKLRLVRITKSDDGSPQIEYGGFYIMRKTSYEMIGLYDPMTVESVCINFHGEFEEI